LHHHTFSFSSRAKLFESLTGKCLLGFTRAATEDYSSYESVDEEEAPPEKPTKGKGKKAAAPIAVKNESEADEKAVKAPAKTAASTLKRKPSKPSVQKGGIASYFTKK
jgi:hypothetical protein